MYFRFWWFSPQLSNVVVNCLNPFFQVDCKSGRILSPDDFKYLARRCVFLSLNLSIPNLFVEIKSALLEPVVFTKRVVSYLASMWVKFWFAAFKWKILKIVARMVMFNVLNNVVLSVAACRVLGGDYRKGGNHSPISWKRGKTYVAKSLLVFSLGCDWSRR